MVRYKKMIDPSFQRDLQRVKNEKLVDPQDWGLFREQVRNEMKLLDESWKDVSKATQFPPLSTHNYRKRYMHSIPVNIKQRRGWEDKRSDFRIVFKVREDEGEIFYLGIGPRIKGLPRDPKDIWAILNSRPLPEEEGSD